MAAHAMEEMAEDYLDIDDVEHVLLTGVLHRIERSDPRGTKYVVHGTALDGATLVGVVGRFARQDRYLIITVYEVADPED
jgi:hypothetical protein